MSLLHDTMLMIFMSALHEMREMPLLRHFMSPRSDIDTPSWVRASHIYADDALWR